MPSVQDPVNAKFIDSFISLCNWLSDVCSQVKYFGHATGDDDNVTQPLSNSRNNTLNLQTTHLIQLHSKKPLQFFFYFNYAITKLLLLSYI